MKFRFFLFLTLYFSSHSFYSQHTEFIAFSIPDSLSKGSDAVVRFEHINIEILSSKKMRVHEKKAITILNKNGLHNAELIFYYDKSTNIRDIQISTYNGLGIEIKKVKNKEIKDYSAADGFSIFNDNRLKYYKDVPLSYPYTIYYEYEYETSNTAFLPRWRPIAYYEEGVEKSTYQLNFPASLSVQKSEQNFENFPVQSDIKSQSISYSIENIAPIKYEEYSPSINDITPLVMLAPTIFHLEGVDGYAQDWNEFGKWMYKDLLQPRMDLPETTKNNIQLLVKDIENPIERAKKVYEFVQNKTRYVSVQVGIGGWMPMLASDVDKLSYGDCKGLTNYTKSLMDVAGVESFYTAVYAGAGIRDLEKNVPSVQGNHVFLYIPNGDDDIWLECTSQDVPFGYQGSFTDDRDVLVISEEGGTIKHTSNYKEENSFQKTRAAINLKGDFSIEANLTIESSGLQYKDHYRLQYLSERELFDHYKSDYWPYINNLKIDSYRFENNKDQIIFTEQLKISARDYATSTGDRVLLHLNTFNRPNSIPERYRNRKLPFKISRGYYDEDVNTITFPSNYSIDAFPENIEIENSFGSYFLQIDKIDAHQVKCTRKILIKKGSYPKEDYKAFRDFKRAIAKYDNSKIVLLKNP